MLSVAGWDAPPASGDIAVSTMLAPASIAAMYAIGAMPVVQCEWTTTGRLTASRSAPDQVRRRPRGEQAGGVLDTPGRRPPGPRGPWPANATGPGRARGSPRSRGRPAPARPACRAARIAVSMLRRSLSGSNTRNTPTPPRAAVDMNSSTVSSAWLWCPTRFCPRTRAWIGVLGSPRGAGAATPTGRRRGAGRSRTSRPRTPRARTARRSPAAGRWARPRRRGGGRRAGTGFRPGTWCPSARARPLRATDWPAPSFSRCRPATAGSASPSTRAANHAASGRRPGRSHRRDRDARWHLDDRVEGVLAAEVLGRHRHADQPAGRSTRPRRRAGGRHRRRPRSRP